MTRRLALLLAVIFVAVGAATVRYFDRALRRGRVPWRATALRYAATGVDLIQGKRRQPKTFADLQAAGLLPIPPRTWNAEGEPDFV